MNKNIFTGRFSWGDSFVHKTKPFIKLILSLIIAIILISYDSFYSTTLIFTLILFISFSSGLRKKEYFLALKFSRIFIWFALFSSFMKYSHDYYFKWLFITISSENLIYALLISFKIYSIILLSTAISTTTSITDFIKGFRGFKLNNFIMICLLALNFIPIIFEEADKIFKAQAARGVSTKDKKIMKRLNNFILIIPPLFLSTLRRSETTSLALYSKCYGMPLPRKNIPKFSFSKYDIIFTIPFIVVVVVIFCINYFNYI
ncbi:MAG: energy-coupling factor transporter transmembrane component T [Clostridiales bacterium]